MGKCANCQRSSFLLKKANCVVCGKEGCEQCFTFLFRILDEFCYPREDVYVCSKKCFESFATLIEEQITPDEITVENIIPPYHYLVERAIFSNSNLKLSTKSQSYAQKKKQPHIWFLKKHVSRYDLEGLGKHFDNVIENTSNPLWQRLYRHIRLIQAKHYETLHEFENAAKIYRDFRMYEEAGKVRGKRNEFVVRKTDISLNLNALLQQVKDGGIVAIYRCPHCNGKLKISNKSTLNSIRTCEHCGSEIEAMDLADFLKTALS
jgi:hypothetical protein